MKLINYLEESGFEVVKINGLNILHGDEGDLSLDVTYKLIREINSNKAEGIFISCTDFKTVELINIIESDFGKNIITSNQATMWKVLRLSGTKTPVSGSG